MLVSKIQEAFKNNYHSSKEELQEKVNLVKGLVVKVEGIKTYVNGELLPNTFSTRYFEEFIRPTNETDTIQEGTYVVNEKGFLPNAACPTKIMVLTNNDGDGVENTHIPISNYKTYHSFIHGI